MNYSDSRACGESEAECVHMETFGTNIKSCDDRSEQAHPESLMHDCP